MAGIRIFFDQIASPGGVNFKKLASPSTLAEYQTKAAEAISSKGNMLLVTEDTNQDSKEVLINVTKVNTIYQE